jgi:hypothetical protein
MMRCHRCGREWTTEKRVKLPGVKETCEECSAYLHCCLNCRFYDPAYNNECQSPTGDWTPDKEGANFCDDFQFCDAEAESAEDTQQNQARTALDDLFGDSARPSDDEQLDRFKHLFDD